MSEVRRLQVRVPKFVKRWADANGYSVSDIVRLGLVRGISEEEVRALSFVTPDYRTTVSLPYKMADRLDELTEITGLSRDRVVSAIATHTLFSLDNSNVLLDKIISSLSSYKSVWLKVYDDVETLKLDEDNALSLCNEEIELSELISKLSKSYNVPPTAVKLFLVDVAKDGKIMIMNGFVKRVKVG